jgi:hypothetical protein
MPFFKKSIEGTRVLQVRASLAFIFSLSMIVGFFMDKIPQEAFTSIAVMSISWYFSKRSESDNDKPDKNEGNKNEQI